MTRQAVETLLRSDATIKPERLRQILDVMDGKTPPQPIARLLTIREAAERFGCTGRTVQRWIATGEIEFVRRGRLVRIPETELCGVSNAKPNP